jgi:hypothetical protein
MVKRYGLYSHPDCLNIESGCSICESQNGDFVKYSDYKLLEEKLFKHEDPYSVLSKKIADAEKCNCISCGNDNDIKVSHQYDGGDLGGRYLIVPLCHACRVKWFCSHDFREELVGRYPKDLEDISF